MQNQIKISHKGTITRVFPSIGFVESYSNNESYEFAITGELKLKAGDIVSFDLKAKDRSNSLIAVDLKLLEKKKIVSKKGKYVFSSISEKNNVIQEVVIPLFKQIIEDSDKDSRRKKVTKGEEEDLALLYEDCENALLNAEEILNHNELNQTAFIIKIQEISSRKNVFKKDVSFVWNQWKGNEREYHDYENKEGLISYTDKGAKDQIHEYPKVPGKSHWPLVKIKQKDKTFYIASASVWNIARTSYVPSLPERLGIQETADRILDKTKKQDEWQREAEIKRVRKIRDFIGRGNNIIANAPMLYITDSKHANINKLNGDRLTIDFNFLKEKGGVYVDRQKLTQKDEFGNTQYKDYRPMWLIDGQHRIKGIHQNTEESQNLTLPIVIFPKEFGASDTAKVFAEINTLQEPLPDLHELFMQHRFNIDHVNQKKKFIDYRNINLQEYTNGGGDKDDWTHSRANSLSYEILAMLSKKGPLKDRVKFLNQNEDYETKQNTLIDAKQWLNYTRNWFYSRPYGYKPELDVLSEIDLYFEEIHNYFQAWLETCNHDEWDDGEDRWTLSGNKKGLIQQKLYFIVLLNLYGHIYNIAKEMQEEDKLLSIDNFKNALKPFKWVDWTHRDLKDNYKGGGEKGRGSLEVWMADALLDYSINKKTYNKDEIINNTIKSKPGRGITSVLSKGKFRVLIGETEYNLDNRSRLYKYPKKNQPITIKCMRPFNARYKAEWRILKDNGAEVNVVNRSVGKYALPAEAEFELNYEKWMDKQAFIQVECSWFNASTETPKPTIKLIHGGHDQN